MKHICLLFATYLLLLAAYPCADESVSGNGLVVVADAHHHDAGECDHCSPFCICSCCATPFQLATHFSEVPLPVITNAAPVTPYHQAYAPDSGFAIWQPPRIA